MSALPVELRGRPRLNPFAFPSDTYLRFILLFVFVIAADIREWFSLAVGRFDLGQKLEQCMGGAPIIGWAAIQSGKGRECYIPFLYYQTSAVAIGLLLLAAVTGAIYWWYPIWEARRLRFKQLDPAEAPELFATLQELWNIAGLRRRPEFLWNPVKSNHLALAFGRAGTYRVGFTGSLALLHNTDPGAFRAVMLHELAHIRNGDVDKAYMALALWWGFLLTGILPHLAVTASQPISIADAVLLLADSAIITGIVLLTRNAVLRARELYADARSFAWCLDEPAFTRVLGGLHPIEGIRRLLSPHPDPARRRRLLDDTDEMFRFGFWDAFGAGAAASFIGITFAAVAAMSCSRAIPESIGALVALLVLPIAIAVPLVAGAATIAIWRKTFVALMRGRIVDHIAPIGIALAGGTVFGGPALVLAVVLTAATGGEGHKYVDQIAAPLFSVFVAALALAVVLTAVLASALVLFLKWVHAGAISWLSVALYARSSRVPFTIGILVSSIVALAWFALGDIVVGFAWFALRVENFSAFSTVWHILIGAGTLFPMNIIAWITLIAFWAYPLAPALWRRGVERKAYSKWPFMNAVPGDVPLVASSLRLRPALIIGVSGALAAGAALPWLQLPLPSGALHDVRFPETAKAAALLSMTLTGMLVPGAIAAVVVLAIPRLSIPHAMFAAFVAGWILIAAEVLQLRTAVPMGIVVEVGLAPVMFGGALFALVCSLTASALRWPIDGVLARLRRRRDCITDENFDDRVLERVVRQF